MSRVQLLRIRTKVDKVNTLEKIRELRKEQGECSFNYEIYQNIEKEIRELERGN